MVCKPKSDFNCRAREEESYALDCSAFKEEAKGGLKGEKKCIVCIIATTQSPSLLPALCYLILTLRTSDLDAPGAGYTYLVYAPVYESMAMLSEVIF